MIDFNLFSKMPLSFDIEDDSQYKEFDVEVNFKSDDFVKTIKAEYMDELIDYYNKLAAPITTIVRSNDIADLAATMIDEFDDEKIVRLMKEVDGLDHEMYVYIINFIYNCAKAKADIATRNTLKRIEYIAAMNTKSVIPSTEIDGNPNIPIFGDSDENLDYHEEDEENAAETSNPIYGEDVVAECIPENGDMTNEEYEAIRDKIENEGIVP